MGAAASAFDPGSNTADVSSPPTATRHSPRTACCPPPDMKSNLSFPPHSRESCAGKLVMRMHFLGLCAVALGAAVTACGVRARVPVAAEMGAHPLIPRPSTSLIPVMKVVKAEGWPGDETPLAADGLTVRPFARGLNHPRWLYVLPNGDVLVAETNAPKRPDDNKGIKGWFFNKFQKKAGGGVRSANGMTLRRDADGDGVAEMRSVLLSNLTSPFGMALVGNMLYVANADAL